MQILPIQQARALIDSLDSAELSQVLAQAAGQESVMFLDLRIDERIRGCQGYVCPKFIGDFVYRTTRGQTNVIRLLVKHFKGWGGGGESEYYRWLMRHNAPVPRMWGALRDPAGDEALFLEWLPYVGYHRSDPADRSEFLRALAMFNATPFDAPETPRLPLHGAAEKVAEILDTCTRLLAQGRAGNLGDAIEGQCARSEWERFPDYVRWIAEQVDHLPVGLVHSDAGTQNVGRREPGGPILLFDLHRICRDCVFTDVARVFTDMQLLREASWQKSAEHYLRVLRESGGPAVAFETFLDVLRVVGPWNRVGFWGWSLARCLDGQVDFTADREEGKRVYRGWMLDHLTETAEELRSFDPVRQEADR
ncbi:MAG: hypothetical protein IT443_02720 [Phycisphaeraceae bacterium]|nr:hypothetical protein [Phycisphaeraceae bacterium]